MHYKHCKKCGTIVVRTCSLMTPPSSFCLHSFFILLSVARRCTAAGTHGIVAQLAEHRAGKKMQVRPLPIPPKRPLWSWWRYTSKGNHSTAYPPAVYDGHLPDGVSYPTIRGGRSHLPSGHSVQTLRKRLGNAEPVETESATKKAVRHYCGQVA